MPNLIEMFEEEINPGVVLPCSPLNSTLLHGAHTYYKLPPHLLNLRVLKLDGTFFDVRVANNATTAELKEAIEEVFVTSQEGRQQRVSWLHVWWHFCLCYEGQKLLNDKASIRSFGIKDGDELEFVRHMSISYEPSKKHVRSQSAAAKQSEVSKRELRALELQGEAGHIQQNDDGFVEYHDDSDGEISMQLGGCLRGWLPYSRLQSGSRRPK